MNAKTQALITLIALGVIDIALPIPIVALLLIYVVLLRPPWFMAMVRDIYGT